MALIQFLGVGEHLLYSGLEVLLEGRRFDSFVTRERLLLHRIEGLVFQNDQLVAERLDDIRGVEFRQSGMVFKESVLRVCTSTRTLDLEASPERLVALHQAIEHARLASRVPAHPQVPPHQPFGYSDQVPWWLAPGAPVYARWTDGLPYVGRVLAGFSTGAYVAFPDGQTQWLPLATLAPRMEAEAKQKTVERQIVVVRCRYCSTLTPVDQEACRGCGADPIAR